MDSHCSFCIAGCFHQMQVDGCGIGEKNFLWAEKSQIIHLPQKQQFNWKYGEKKIENIENILDYHSSFCITTCF